MKKILILLFTILILPSSCLAVTPPRWYTMPVNVYIPEHPKAQLMKKAFMDLQNSTGYIKFRFLDAQGERRAHIVVYFVKRCSMEGAVGVTYQPQKKHAFLRNTIQIGLINPNTNKIYSNDELYVIMIHEAGHAIGMNHTPNPSDIMYPVLNNKQRSLTKNDINQIIMLYR